MSIAEQSMGLGLRALRGIAGLELIDRVGLRDVSERLVHSGAKNGFRGAAAASRTFTAAARLGRPARQRPRSTGGLFDLTPDDEQEMLVEAVTALAAERLRPAAVDADAACAAPAPVLASVNEMGVSVLGVPEELGGVVEERSAVTAVLVAAALAHGDIGLTVAALAPGAVATAIGLWGDEEQQATYLPAFTGDEVVPAALAVLEPQPLFDPYALRTTARKTADGFVLTGAKALVPRGAEAELLVVAAELEGRGPALFLVESGTPGITVTAEPAMGLRAAATATLTFQEVALPAGALLGGADPAVYAECIDRARIAWCALSVGCAKAVLDYVIPHVNERVAFGEPISNRQAVAFMVADIGIELEGMRLTTLRAASRADLGKDFGREAALARVLCAEKGVRIGSDGVQLLGGHGYVKEHPVERWYRDLRATGVMEGALLV
jgi:alkylation response protein AidB-like acyl-CoA dehydrogenase